MEREDHNVVLAVSHGISCFTFLSNWQDVEEIRKKVYQIVVFSNMNMKIRKLN